MKDLQDQERIIIDTINTIHRANGIADISPKRANTNGGEWYGPCIRCYKLTGNAGEDHFIVWPSRPIESPGNRMSPVFYCRRCLRDNGQAWTGDLPGYLCDILSVSWQEARKMLNLGAVSSHAARIVLAPTESITGAPNFTWQERLERLVQECEDLLWSHAGALALKYLMQERGLNEATIRGARLGYQQRDNFYEDAEIWGQDPEFGRVRIHKGILIPEMHRPFGGNGVEFWSGTIRRSNRDIHSEALREGIPLKRVAKAPSIKGSTKSFLYAESIHSEKPAVIVEGWACALTAIQEAGDIIGCGATQSATGARDTLAMKTLSSIDNILLCYDADLAGINGSVYWLDMYESKIMDYSPEAGIDLNSMHTSGKSVREYILRGLDIQTKRKYVHSSYNRAERPLHASAPQDIDQLSTEPSVSISEPVFCRHVDIETGEVCMLSIDDNHCHDEVMSSCIRCGEEVSHYDVHGNAWCANHVMCCQLIDLASSLEFPATYVKAGDGLSSFNRENDIPVPVMKTVTGCRVGSGIERYLACCVKAEEAQVWRLMMPLQAKKQEVLPPLIEEEMSVIESKTVPVFGSLKLHSKKSTRATKQTALLTEKVVVETCVCFVLKAERRDGMGLMTHVRCSNVPQSGLFCEEHAKNLLFLQYGEVLGYPELRLNELVRIEEGYNNWMEHAKRRLTKQLAYDVDVVLREIKDITA